MVGPTRTVFVVQFFCGANRWTQFRSKFNGIQGGGTGSQGAISTPLVLLSNWAEGSGSMVSRSFGRRAATALLLGVLLLSLALPVRTVTTTTAGEEETTTEEVFAPAPLPPPDSRPHPAPAIFFPPQLNSPAGLGPCFARSGRRPSRSGNGRLRNVERSRPPAPLHGFDGHDYGDTITTTTTAVHPLPPCPPAHTSTTYPLRRVNSHILFEGVGSSRLGGCVPTGRFPAPFMHASVAGQTIEPVHFGGRNVPTFQNNTQRPTAVDCWVFPGVNHSRFSRRAGTRTRTGPPKTALALRLW